MSKRLLPLIPSGLVVVQVLPTSERLTVVAEPCSIAAACPTCGRVSRSVHSRYERILGDLPWQGRPVSLRILARRFRCIVEACLRQTFAERLSDVAVAAARRMERLGSLHGCLGMALGGEPGARLAIRLAIGISADTLLRTARDTGRRGTPAPTPRVLSVDDWAWRRGRRYGTVLVDMERNAVVDLLPDRQAGTLDAWLQSHPGVEVIARDRAGAYADGTRQGAPDAIQVADRWHLLCNLSTAVQAIADRHGAIVRRAAQQVADEFTTKKVTPAPATAPAPAVVSPPTAAERRSEASHVRRQARYEEAARLHQQGVFISRIATLLDTSRFTVRGWLRLGHAPLWRMPRHGGALAAHAALLERRWAEGCRNAARLWRELVAAGYPGRASGVRAWAGRRRKAEQAAGGTVSATAKPLWQPPPSSRLGRLLMTGADALMPGDRRFVAHLFADIPGLMEAVAVANRLRRLLQRESKESLADFLDVAATTPLAAFAAGLRRDLDAVQAALDTPWTTSFVEGQVNRIKTIKRSMYGRAGFDLLRARVLNPA